MKHQKHKILERYREHGEGCLCMSLLWLRYDKLRAQSEYARERLSRMTVDSKNWNKQLGHVLKFGNKLKVIKDLIREIQTSHEIANKMVEVPIAGRTFYRISHYDDYRRSCKGKQPYSEGAVKIAAVEMAAKLDEPMEPYKCRHCQHWHVGHAIFRDAEVIE